MTVTLPLSAPWWAELEEAWTASCEGSYAIGACIADEHGKVLARGRNRLAEPRRVHGAEGSGFVAGHDLAHAEINALLDLREKRHPECYGWTVYTTVEPCPQCAGAVAMSSIRGLSYAAADPWAGAADILTGHRYVSRKGMRVGRAPEHVQRAALRLVLTCFLEAGDDPEAPVMQSFLAVHPQEFRIAQALYHAGTLTHLRARRAGLDEVLAALESAPVPA